MKIINKCQDKEKIFRIGDILVVNDRGIEDTFLICRAHGKIRAMSLKGFFATRWEYDSEEELTKDLKDGLDDIEIYNQEEYGLELVKINNR